MKLILCVLAWATFQAHAQNLLQNGNFATGDFTGWSLTGNDSYSFIVTNGSIDASNSSVSFGSPPPGSTYYAALGPYAPPVVMSQAIATTPGHYYTFSFYVAHTTYDGITSSETEFTAGFAGDEVLDNLGTPIPGWTLENFLVEATAPSETVQFTSESYYGYYQVGDVSVVDDGPVPLVLSIQATNNEGVVISWPASYTGYVLEQNAVLNTTNWVLNTNTVSMVNGTNQVLIRPATNNMYFRLILP